MFTMVTTRCYGQLLATTRNYLSLLKESYKDLQDL
jgi:hypothetical protein